MDNAAEYCLLWIRWWPICMTKSEWASWAQAVFSVLAIAVAVWLGQRSAREASHGAMSHYILFKQACRKSLDEASRRAKSHDREGVLFGLAALEEAVQLGRSVPVHLLPEQHAMAAIRMRSVVAKANSFVDRSMAQRVPSFQHIEGRLTELMVEMNEIDSPAAGAGCASG